MSTLDAPATAGRETLLNRGLHIDGAWVAGTALDIDVQDPSTGEVIGRVANATPDDGRAAVEAAGAALGRWRDTSPRERAEILRRCFELMTERSAELAWLISLENGKTLADSRGEVAYAAEFFRWYSEEAVRLIGETSLAPSGANRIVVEHEPVGVALLITPWNFPAAMATRKIAPALAAGCSVILKPASLTPLTAYAIADILQRAGVPDGVVNVVTTEDTDRVVDAVLADDRVRKLSFTGSTEVGRILLHKAADRILNCSMELGGNAPFIVCADADVELALDGLMIAKMRNNGQACTAANRVLVHRSVLDHFVTSLSGRFAEISVGAATDESTGCGPVVDDRSLRRIERLLEHETAEGAETVVGGRAMARPGHFLEPTVLAGLSGASAILKQEIFGPVAPVLAFDDVDEAVQLANDTDMGLAAYVYSADEAQAGRIARRVDCGMVAVNRGMVSDPAAPFGGTKQSGLGREGGHVGVLEFMETKYLATAI